MIEIVKFDINKCHSGGKGGESLIRITTGKTLSELFESSVNPDELCSNARSLEGKIKKIFSGMVVKENSGLENFLNNCGVGFGISRYDKNSVVYNCCFENDNNKVCVDLPCLKVEEGRVLDSEKITFKYDEKLNDITILECVYDVLCNHGDEYTYFGTLDDDLPKWIYDPYRFNI